MAFRVKSSICACGMIGGAATNCRNLSRSKDTLPGRLKLSLGDSNATATLCEKLHLTQCYHTVARLKSPQ